MFRRRRVPGCGCFGCLPLAGLLPLIVIGAIIYFLVNRKQGPPPPPPYVPPSVPPPNPPVTGGSGYCNQCGAQLTGGKFCPGCGAPV